MTWEEGADLWANAPDVRAAGEGCMLWRQDAVWMPRGRRNAGTARSDRAPAKADWYRAARLVASDSCGSRNVSAERPMGMSPAVWRESLQLR